MTLQLADKPTVQRGSRREAVLPHGSSATDAFWGDLTFFPFGKSNDPQLFLMGRMLRLICYCGSSLELARCFSHPLNEDIEQKAAAEQTMRY